MTRPPAAELTLTPLPLPQSASPCSTKQTSNGADGASPTKRKGQDNGHRGVCHPRKPRHPLLSPAFWWIWGARQEDGTDFKAGARCDLTDLIFSRTAYVVEPAQSERASSGVCIYWGTATPMPRCAMAVRNKQVNPGILHPGEQHL